MKVPVIVPYPGREWQRCAECGIFVLKNNLHSYYREVQGSVIETLLCDGCWETSEALDRLGNGPQHLLYVFHKRLP